MKNIIIILQIVFAMSLSAASIESGKYILTLNIPGLKKNEDTIKLNGKITIKDKDFTFDTFGAGGNAIKMKGKIIGNDLLIWVSSEERGKLITYHLTGKLVDDKDHEAEGEVSLYLNHDKAAKGHWKLRRAESTPK